MLLNRKKYNGFGDISEILLTDATKDHMHKCMVAEQSITEGDFSLPDALEAYGLSREEYENYIAGRSAINIIQSLSGATRPHLSTSITHEVPAYFAIMEKLLDTSFDDRVKFLLQKRMKKVHDQFKGMLADIREAEESQG